MIPTIIEEGRSNGYVSDVYSHLLKNRVIFIKDGEVFHEINRGNDKRNVFFNKIIDVIALLGGDVSDVI